MSESLHIAGRGFGFITFKNPDDSKRFMEHEGGHSIDGKMVDLKEAQPKTAEEVQAQRLLGQSGLSGPGSKKIANRLNPPATKLFVGGASFIEDDEFRTYWEAYGELEDCAIVRDAR